MDDTDYLDDIHVPGLTWARGGVEAAGVFWVRRLLLTGGDSLAGIAAAAATAPERDTWLVEAATPHRPGVYLLLARRDGCVALLAEGRAPTPAWWGEGRAGGDAGEEPEAREEP